MRFFTDELPKKARSYLVAVTVTGLLITFYCYVRVFTTTNGDWIYLGGLTGIVAFLPVRLRFSGDQIVSVSFTITDIFIFCALLFFSPEVAVVIGTIDGFLVSLQFLDRSRAYRFLFNIAQVATCVFLVGHLFYLLQGHAPPLSSLDGGPATFVHLGICGFLYVILNTTAVAVAMYLAKPGAGGSLWRASIVPSAFSTMAGALTSAAVFYTFVQESAFGIVISLPLLLVLYTSYRMANERVEGLLESRDLLQDSLDALNAHIAVLDETGKIVVTNESWQGAHNPSALFGSHLKVGTLYGEFLEQSRANLPESRDIIARALRDVVEGRQDQFSCEYSHTTGADTSWFIVRITLFKGVVPVRLVVAHENISEQKRAEERLKASEEKYRRFFDEDLTGDFTAGVNGEILTFNPAFAMIFGFKSLEEVGESNLFSLFPSRELVDETLAAIQQSRKLEYHEIELRRVDLEPVHIVANITGYFDEKGVLSRIRGYLFDDTARKRLEEELRQAQKMEAVGQLAGGIAHDLNNILTVITGYAEFLKESLWDSIESRDDAQAILDAVGRAQGLTQKLLTFSRHQVLRPEVLDINRVVGEFCELVRRVIRGNIRIKTKLDPQAGSVKIDPGQIEQVLMNLSVNAQDAMPEGGTLTIQTQKRHLQEAGEDDPSNLTAGDYVIVSVLDQGEGVSESVRERMFEPFFTTKPTGQGTGLGLSIVYGIVTKAGGRIQVRDNPGGGTVFEIWFPAEAEREVPVLQPAVAESDVVTSGDETILLVEDEDRIRELITEVLRRKGYTVFEASNGEKALPLARELGTFDLLITDLVMPVLGGWELARELRKGENGANIRVLYISGYSDSISPDLLKQEEKTEGVSFLAKPFSPDALLRKVREILGTADPLEASD